MRVEKNKKKKYKFKLKFLSNLGKKNTKKNIKTNKVKGKNTRAKEVTTSRKKRSLWKKILTFILICGIICVFMVAAFFAYIALTAPKFDESKFEKQDQTVIYDINNEIITTLGTEKRESISYDELPQVLIDAIIATEDSRYYQHNGVDLPRFLKASILQVLGQGGGGASTITMQVVKNNLTSKDATGIKGIIRKFQDVYLSVFKVEKKYSKQEILEFYVNSYYLGGSAYGVQKASDYYFGKDVSELTLPEAALIAGLFQTPGKDNPYKDIDRATSRRKMVLKYMYNHGYISKEEQEIANSIPIESLLSGNKEVVDYQGYVDTVVDEVEELTGNNPYNVAMIIYTTMERSIQDGINSVLSSKDGSLWKDDAAQAGIAVINVETGAISAIGAGRNRTGERTFNYATDAYRQPGSTAKPIFAYGPGIESNNFSSYTLFNDEKWSYTNGPNVNNWDGGYLGLITARRALQVSRNVPAVKAFQQIGTKNVQKFAHNLGLDVSLNSSSDNYKVYSTGIDNTVNEAYAIGGVAKGFTPLEMAAAYSGFASGGYYTSPYTVTKIEYRESGEVVEHKTAKERVMKDSTAYIMNNILESAVTSGFNGGANVYGSHVAAKTGTSNYDEATMKKYHLPGNAVNDLWTVAYTSKYSVAVWYGYKETTNTTYNTSGSYKENVTRAVMKYIPKDTKGWTMPSSVTSAVVEAETSPAKLASENTPSELKLTEYFVKGTQPTEVSERFNTLPEVENIKLAKNNNTVTITWDFTTPNQLTDKYIEEYFSQSVFGNSTKELIEKRKKYNEESLGKVGFAIYKEDDEEKLTLIDFTYENKYTYTGYGNTKLVIKTEYAKYKSCSSKGMSVNLELGNQEIGIILATLNGKLIENAKTSEYVEAGFKKIYYNTIDITNTATIKYQVTTNDEIKNYTTKTELENAINLLPIGSYKITYIISYLGNEKIISRTVILT